MGKETQQLNLNSEAMKIVQSFEQNTDQPDVSSYEIIELGGIGGGLYVAKNKPGGEIIMVRLNGDGSNVKHR